MEPCNKYFSTPLLEAKYQFLAITTQKIESISEGQRFCHKLLPDSRRYENVLAMHSRSSSGSRVRGGLFSNVGATKGGGASSWKGVTERGCMICSDKFTARPSSDSLLIFSSASKGWDLKGRAFSITMMLPDTVISSHCHLP